VQVTARSIDVLHTFYVPALRVKQDVIPGRDRKFVFVATEPGRYPIACVDACMGGRENMGGMLEVVESSTMDAALARHRIDADHADTPRQ
jgi:cytochrome c oxidase subunit 2